MLSFENPIECLTSNNGQGDVMLQIEIIGCLLLVAFYYRVLATCIL